MGSIFTVVPVQIVGVVSRKLHGAAGAFDIDLPLSGDPGTECRSGGVDNAHTIVFTFANTLTSVGGVALSSGAGAVSSSGIDADAHNYVVNLTGVSNGQVITVSLTKVNDSAGNRSSSLPISLGMLVGDSNGDGFVNAGDSLQVRSRSGQPINPVNFRSDANTDGFLNSGDTIAVRARSGTFLP